MPTADGRAGRNLNRDNFIRAMESIQDYDVGGFKVSFGIAHRLARFVVDEIAGLPTLDLPESFLCRNHIAALREKHL